MPLDARCLNLSSYLSRHSCCSALFTVPLETISAFACGNTSSLPIVFTAKSPRLDENRNRGKDESNRMPRPT